MSGGPFVTDDEKGLNGLSPKVDETTRLATRSKSEQHINMDKSMENGNLADNAAGKLTRTLSLGNHTITMEEVAPQQSAIVGKEDERSWMATLNIFSSKRTEQVDRKLPRSIRRYYKQQNELIKAYEQASDPDGIEIINVGDQRRKQAALLAKVSFACNFVLLVGKIAAAVMSGSLSVITSVIDSAVDLVSGALMWCSGRAVKKRDPYNYPQGRTKLEPIAIVVLSVVMALASFQMILQAVEKIIGFAVYDTQDKPPEVNMTEIICTSRENVSDYVIDEGPSRPDFGIDSIVICLITIVVKLVLFLVCRRVPSPSTQALAQDHRNDVLSNSVAVACGLIGAKLWKYADSIGAILISIYIIASWFITGWRQIKMLTGHTARPEFLKKITWIAVSHSHKITHIETVRAFHFGNNFLVEVDIVLPKTMALLEAHDIGETLQAKLEKLEDVERAFVHLDYDIEHDPGTEHKAV